MEFDGVKHRSSIVLTIKYLLWFVWVSSLVLIGLAKKKITSML